MAKPIELEKAYEQAVQARDVPKVLRIINGFEPGSIPPYAADALHFVCYYGSLDDIKTLIAKYKYPTDTRHSSRSWIYRGALLHVVCNRYRDTKKEVSSILEYLINEVGLSTDVISEYGDGLPLHVACARRSLDRVKMVSVGCDVNRQDEAGNTPLHMACQNGSTDIVQYLVEERKCDFNVANNKGELPLHLACKLKYYEIVRLVSVGCDVNRQDEAGNTPLHMACQNGSTDMVRYLVEKRKCDFNVVNNKGELPLHLACEHRNSKTIVQLVSVGCDVNRQDKAGNTPLHMACQNGSTDMVRYLVEEKKCGFNVANNKGELPLHLACKRMYGKEIVQLVSVGCDVNRQDEAGNTPLHMACQNGSADIVQYLVEEKKCGFNVANNKGELPLHLACKHQYSKTIVRLVSVGCDVNRQDEAGDTPLHMACQNGTTDMVRYLVEEKKCGFNVANNNGELPLHLACKRMYGKEIVWLVSVGCDVNRQDAAGNTPLHMACRNSDTGIVKFLVEERKCVVDHVALNICGIEADTSRSSLYASISLRTSKHTIKSKQCGLTLLNAVTSESNTRSFFEETFKNKDYDACLCLMMVGQCDVYTQIDGIDKCDVVYTLLCKFTSEHGIACTRPTSLIEGDTILHVASYNCQSALIKHLIQELDLSPSIANSKQEYPLHIACRTGCSLEVIELLARYDVNRQDEAGNTPLHIAFQNGSTDMVQYLVKDRKCDVNVANNRGELPLHLACQHQYGIEIVRLVSVGCDVNRQDEAGSTPLHIACQNHSIDMVQYLVMEKECDVNVANKGEPRCATIPFNAPTSEFVLGRTPFEEAYRNAGYNICWYLMMVGQCDVYTQIDGIDKCDVVYTLLCKFTSEHGIACTRPTSLIEGDTILHVASYNWQSSYSLMKHLIHVIHFNPSKMNSRQEYSLHIACRLGCSLEVMELLGNCDVDHQDIDGNTPLHLVCLHHPMRDDMISWLLGSKDCSTNIMNNTGKKIHEILSLDSIITESCPQRSSCIKSAALIYLKNLTDFDLLAQNMDTILHIALRNDDDYLIQRLVEMENFIDYLTVKNVFHELPLHLAARTCDVHKVKLVSSGINPNAVTIEGSTALHEVCRTSNCSVEAVKFLCEDLSSDPNLPNLEGDTPLHLACYQGSFNVVEYLVSVAGVNVDMQNNAHCTPLMNTSLECPEIVKLLVEHGANPQHLYNTYKHFFDSYSSEKPPPTPLNIIVIGKHATGKSTLIKALESEGCQDMVHAEAFTAGIIPSAYESESFGSVIWYDLAGQSEYYASHEAILHTILSASPPLILLLVDIRKDLKYIQQDILYWLNFLHQQSPSKSVGTRPHLVVVLSFVDLSPTEESEEKIQNVRKYLAPDFQRFQLEPVSFIALDCRMPNSDKIVLLRSQLSVSFKELCGIAKMNFILHCFYAFLLGNFKSKPAITASEVLALSEDWIKSGIDPLSLTDADFDDGIDWDDFIFESKFEEKIPVKLLPVQDKEILRLCEELSNKGHIILIKYKSDIEKSWLIIQKEVLLNEVNGSLFAPQHFRQHFKELSTNTGVVSLSGLVKHFPHHDPDMLIGFLTHMEFCREINDEVILQLLTESDFKSKDPQRYFFFPGLVSIEKPEKIWKDNGDYSNKCGWIIETTQANEFFTPRFLQVLQLRIAFNFPLSVVNRRIIGFTPPTIQRRCSVWKNGISWKTGSGLECLVEVTEQCQAVVLMLRSISSSQDLTSHYISYRSSLIKVITSAVSDICPSLEVSESFCHPDHIRYPPQSCEDTALYSLPSIAHTICKLVQLVLCDDPEHDSIELVKLVTFEPFSHFNFHHFFNSFEKDNIITDDYLRRVSKSICSNEAGRTVYMMFTQEQNIPTDLKLSADAIFEVLVDWRDSKHATYSDLHCHLSQYSIFCDRDPQVRMEC